MGRSERRTTIIEMKWGEIKRDDMEGLIELNNLVREYFWKDKVIRNSMENILTDYFCYWYGKAKENLEDALKIVERYNNALILSKEIGVSKEDLPSEQEIHLFHLEALVKFYHQIVEEQNTSSIVAYGLDKLIENYEAVYNVKLPEREMAKIKDGHTDYKVKVSRIKRGTTRKLKPIKVGNNVGYIPPGTLKGIKGPYKNTIFYKCCRIIEKLEPKAKQYVINQLKDLFSNKNIKWA